MRVDDRGPPRDGEPAEESEAGGTPARTEGFGRRCASLPKSKMRRGRDSNPRGFRLPLFESGTINHSDTSPGRSLAARAFRKLDTLMSLDRVHYAWVVTAVTFLALLAASSVRAAPGVIIIPLESE